LIAAGVTLNPSAHLTPERFDPAGDTIEVIQF